MKNKSLIILGILIIVTMAIIATTVVIINNNKENNNKEKTDIDTTINNNKEKTDIDTTINNNKEKTDIDATINNNKENADIVAIINNNSNLPVKYMSKYDYDWEHTNLNEYDKLNNYMSRDFKNKDISFSYYGYPNDECEYFLGEIVLLTNKYNILGVTIGDNMKQSISKIQKYGFELDEKNNYFVATLNYKDFMIEIKADIENYVEDEDNVVIGTIKLHAKSKYIGDRVY